MLPATQSLGDRAMPAESAFIVAAVDRALEAELRSRIDGKTKPRGSLGQLEATALQIGLIQRTLTPELTRPVLVVCAADHGVAEAGVSAFPAAVTAQMVLNFLAGGAAINVFAVHNGLELKIVDAGVDYDFTAAPGLISAKVARGTRSFIDQPAMTAEQCQQALSNGAALVDPLHADGSNIIGFGEMGIGNTASAALLMALMLDLPVAHCTGAGTGLDSAGINRKIALLEKSQQRILAAHDVAGGRQPAPLAVLREAGGFEIATICGAILRAAELQMVVLIDGFITTAALLIARGVAPAVTDYCIYSHCSAEAGHRQMLQALEAQPLLQIDLRLGEGTGAALAYPLVSAAVAFLNDMASFSSAGVSNRADG